MGVAYSQDLRHRVIEAVDGGMSKMKAHQTFRVSRSTIDDWLQLRSETGQLKDKPNRRFGRAPAISDLATFEAFAKRYSHATLGQMASAWENETGQKLSINTFSLTLRRLEVTRKKNAICIENDVKPNEPSSSSN